MRLLSGLRLVSLCLCAGVLAEAGPVWEQTVITWNGGASSAWNDPANWSGTQLPHSNWVAQIASGSAGGYFPVVTSDTTVGAVSVGGCPGVCDSLATLGVAPAATLTLLGAQTRDGGTIDVSGTLHFADPEAVFLNPLATLQPQSQMTFVSQLTLGNSGSQPSGGLLTMYSAEISGGDLILAQGDTGQQISSYGASAMNLGTLSGPGAVVAYNGTLTLNYSGAGAGGPMFIVDHGATLNLNPSGNGASRPICSLLPERWEACRPAASCSHANPDSTSPVLISRGIDMFGTMTVQGNASNPNVRIQSGGQGLQLAALGYATDTNPTLVIGPGTQLTIDQIPGDTGGTGLYLGDATIRAAAGSSTSALFNNVTTRQFGNSAIDGVDYVNGGYLDVTGTLTVSGGSLVNNGDIWVESGAGLNVATTDSTINGTGRLSLYGGSLSGDNLTNGSGHAIDGYGTIASTSLVNHGEIASYGALSINATSVTNAADGRMIALGGGALGIGTGLSNEGWLSTSINFGYGISGGTITIGGDLANTGTVDVAGDRRKGRAPGG